MTSMITDRPIVSICIPTYNRCDALKKCIESIVCNNSVLNSVEIIVSDNLSSDNTQTIMLEYVKKYPDTIRYYRQNENIGGERNFIFVLEHGNGALLKLHNDYSIFTAEGLRELLSCVRNNMEEKPLLYFRNIEANQDVEIVNCQSIGDFVDNSLMTSAWIGSYGYWKEDFDKIYPKDEKIATQFMQLDWFLKIFEQKKYCKVIKYRFSERINFASAQGDYNMFKIKCINYLGMFKPYLNKCLSRKSYNNLKRVIYENLIGWIFKIYIQRDKNFNFDKYTSGMFSIMVSTFWKHYWAYTDPFVIAYKYLILKKK